MLSAFQRSGLYPENWEAKMSGYTMEENYSFNFLFLFFVLCFVFVNTANYSVNHSIWQSEEELPWISICGWLISYKTAHKHNSLLGILLAQCPDFLRLWQGMNMFHGKIQANCLKDLVSCLVLHTEDIDFVKLLLWPQNPSSFGDMTVVMMSTL